MTKRERDRRPRVAHISFHSSPQDQPGTGDSGGMNVYITEVARRLAEQGIAVDVFTRCRGRGADEIEHVAPGSRIIQVQSGPCAPVSKDTLPELLPTFFGGVVRHAAREAAAHGEDAHRHSPYDVVHSHYWLSGWVGERAKQIWGVPHIASFHTLAKVKNERLPSGARPEPRVRVAGESRLARSADRILAPTPSEADELVGLYGADRTRIRVVAPGVDAQLFRPVSKAEAKAKLGVGDGPLLLFVGRLQPLKGPDLAIRAFARAVALAPETMREARLALVGGPSGPGVHGERDRLGRIAASVGVFERLRFVTPQPHARLAAFYSAADAVLMPSRSESFGLVALEAQACGTPVVAAAAGGLRYAIVDGVTGFLVERYEADAYAERILAIVRDRALGASLGKAAVRHAERFSWDRTVADLRGIYDEVAAR